jgi:membrane glycosyltransferase
MALVTGIISYLASPLWLLFLGLSGYVAMAGPEPAPALPGVLANADTGSDTGMLLIGITALLLFGPRLLALVDQKLAGRVSRFGGLPGLCRSTLTETLAALALAPIRMFAHSLYVVRALLNFTVGWQGQNRTGDSSPGTQLRRFGLPVAMAITTLALIQWQIPVLTPWALPVTLPVLLAPFLTCWFNGMPAGRHWLQTPEDGHPPAVIQQAGATNICRKPWQNLSWVEQLVLSPVKARNSASGAEHLPRPLTGKKREALGNLVQNCAEQGQSALNHQQMSLICNHPEALEALHLRIWHARAGESWQRALARMADSVNGSAAPNTAHMSYYPEEVRWIDAAS